MRTALIVIGSVAIAASALPLLKHEAWWIRICDFPRLQIFCILAITLPLYLLTTSNFSAFEGVFVAAMALSLARQVTMMYPYFSFSRKQVQQSRNAARQSSLSLLNANVMMSNRNSARLREIIQDADPDLILALETDDWWRQQLQAFESSHRWFVLKAQDNTYGMLLYSKLELVNPRVEFLVQDDIPSIHALVRLRSGQEIELHCLHPRPPWPSEDESSIGRDAELLIVGKKIKDNSLPTIVFGDLNDVAWSRTNYLFQDVSGLLDPRIGRGFYNTFHASYPFLRFPLDHFFHSNHFRLIHFRRLSHFGSDHFPVYIELNFEPDAAQEQEELHPTAEQQKEASEKIEEAT